MINIRGPINPQATYLGEKITSLRAVNFNLKVDSKGKAFVRAKRITLGKTEWGPWTELTVGNE